MIGAPVLLLLGVTSPFVAEDMPAHFAVAARPSPAATGVPLALKKSAKRPRSLQRRVKRNDITEMLRAMNMMQIGIAPAQEQTPAQNR